MKRLRVRRAQPGDLDRLVEIENAVFATDRLSRASFRNRLKSASASLIVGVLDGRVAAYALIAFRRGSDKARLFSIARAPDAPAGCGGRLLEAAEREAIRRGCASLRLEAREDNAPALALYDRAGYRPFARFENYYEDGAPAVRFEKNLRSAAPDSRVRARVRSEDAPGRTPRRRAGVR